MARGKKARISILNWMGTLLLCSIPGVNLIAAILILIFAKAPSKRTFAWAVLIWTLILIAGYVAFALLLPDKLTALIEWLRTQGAMTVADKAGPLLQ